MAKAYEREVMFCNFLDELKGSGCDILEELIKILRESLWQVLHVAIKPPGNEQEEVFRPSALADLERGNTFNYCVAELERFAWEYPLLAAKLRFKERIGKFKSP